MIKGSNDNFEVPVGKPISTDAKVKKEIIKMKEDKTLTVTECPHCKTEYRYENIEELKPIKGFFGKVFTPLGSNVEVWATIVQCTSEKFGKLFVPVLKRTETAIEADSISRSYSESCRIKVKDRVRPHDVVYKVLEE